MIEELIELTGIASYLCIVGAVLLGLARWRLHWRRPRPIVHYVVGLLGAVFATLHVSMIWYFSR